MAILLQRSILQQVLKVKKEEVFEWFTTKIWHKIKANVVTFWGQVLLWTMHKIFSQKEEVGYHEKYEHGMQVSKYDIFKGNFE
jgi:hypothetical protein